MTNQKSVEMKKSYGSGNFGNWITDGYGLPAYDYTCDQYQIPEKMPLVNKDSIWGDYRLSLIHI